MPRVKTLRAEIGTTGYVESFDVTQWAAEDIARAVELEHTCSDSHCDIAAALRADCPLTAAYLLQGATETPLLDAVCAFHDNPQIEPSDWHEWETFHKEHGRECQSCGSFNYEDEETLYACGNCLAEFPPRPDEDADAFVCEPAYGGIGIRVEGMTIDTGFDAIENALRFLWYWTKDHDFYPETWYVNERGNTTLLVRTDNPDEPYTFSDIGYV